MEGQIQQAKERAQNFTKSLEESRYQEAAVMKLLENERTKWTETLEEKGVLIEQLERELEATVDEIHRHRKAVTSPTIPPDHHSTSLHSELDLVTKAKDMSKRILNSYRDNINSKPNSIKESIHAKLSSTVSSRLYPESSSSVNDDEVASLKARLHVTQVERDYLLKELQAISLTASQEIDSMHNEPLESMHTQGHQQDQYIDYNHREAQTHGFQPLEVEYERSGQGYEYTRENGNDDDNLIFSEGRGYQYNIDPNISTSYSSAPHISRSQNGHTHSGDSLHEKTLQKIHDGLELVSKYRKYKKLGQVIYSDSCNQPTSTYPETDEYDYNQSYNQNSRHSKYGDNTYDNNYDNNDYTATSPRDETQDFIRSNDYDKPSKNSSQNKSLVIIKRRKKKKIKTPRIQPGPGTLYVLNSDQCAQVTGRSTAAQSTATSRLASHTKPSKYAHYNSNPNPQYLTTTTSSRGRYLDDDSAPASTLLRLYSTLSPQDIPRPRSVSPRYSTRGHSTINTMHSSILQPTESSSRRQSPAVARSRSNSVDSGVLHKYPWIPSPISVRSSAVMRDRSDRSINDSKQHSSYKNSQSRIKNNVGKNRGVDVTNQSNRFTIIQEREKQNKPRYQPREPPKLITVINPEISNETLLYELSEGGDDISGVKHQQSSRRSSSSSRSGISSMRLNQTSNSRDSRLGLPKMSMSIPTIAPSMFSKVSSHTRQSFSSLNSCGSNLHDHLHLQQTEASAQKLVYPPLRQSFPFTPASALSVTALSNPTSTTATVATAAHRHWNSELINKKKKSVDVN